MASIPSVNFTFQDGALGAIPANVSKVCVKMGICSKATASVAATALVGSTTSPDGVTYTAVAPGAAGNGISVTYTTGASSGPVVTVVGKAITVQIKVGTTTNTLIVAAIAASAAASALVTAVATGGSDLAIATAQVFLSTGTLLVPSTTAGDGVQFSAKSNAGATIVFTTGAATETPVITVTGSTITVQIKSATTLNSDVVTAVQGNSAASALVGVAATGASDLSIAFSSTSIPLGTLGTTGNIDTLFSETNPTQAVTDLGYGPLTEAVARSLDIAGGQVLAMPLNPSVAGTVGSVTHVGTGAPTIPSVSGTPNDAYSVVLLITLGGALGVGQFQFSQDGGNTFSATYVLPSGGTFVIPNTGLTVTFNAGTYVANDTYSFNCTAPGYTLTDVQNGVNALLLSGTKFGFIHLVGAASSASGSASMAAGLETLMLSAQNTYFTFTHAVLETFNDTDANLETAFGSTVCTRVMVCAGWETVSSSVPGSGDIFRNCGFDAAAREALVPEQNSLGRVKDGAVPGVISISRNEALTPGLDALNFTTMRTWVGLPGFYFTNGHMFESVGSDFAPSQNRRVIDLAATIAYPATVQFLNDTLRLNLNGTVTAAQATTIQDQVNGAIQQGVVAPGAAINSFVVIDQTNNVYATKTLNEAVRVQPFGYPTTIAVNLGFTNPSLFV